MKKTWWFWMIFLLVGSLLVEFLKLPWLSLVPFGTLCSFVVSFGILSAPSNIKHFLIKIVFVWFWNFQKTPNRLRNFAVGTWRHEYAHGSCLDWKYHVAFHDRRTRILWNTDRGFCFHDSLSDLALNATINGYLSVCLFDSTIYYFSMATL